MSTFCPEWIFDLCCGMIANEFIEKNTTLPAITKKYSESISKEFNLIDPELFEEATEQFLLLLNELEVGEDALKYLTGYCCYKINFINPNTKRNLSGIFSKELKGSSGPEYDIKKAKKSFKSYIFSMRSGQMELAPPGWKIEKDIPIEFLKEIPSKDVGIENLFN